MKLNDITINAAFYELFESTFGEDFFTVLASMKQSPRITNLRKKDAKDLTEEEKEELDMSNLELASVMKKYTPRIAYIGRKLYMKKFSCSYADYLCFLSECESSTFLDPEVIASTWELITKDQIMPSSVKNA